MKKILIITNYYPPEIGAASNRIFHLAEGLHKRNFEVSVVTPLPNYPTGKIFKPFQGKFKQTHIEKGIKVHRLWLYATVSKNKFLRLFAMLCYSFSLLWFFIFNKVPKTVIVQSPPLIVAFTAMFFLNSKKRKLILNVSDLWPLAGLELGALKKNYSYKLLEKMAFYNYKKAHLVLCQSEEIITHIKSLIPNKNTFLYRNFPNFIAPKANVFKNDIAKINIVYAGLLGVAQGVLKLCEELNYNSISFHIYGSGAEQKQIITFINEHPNLPIYFHGSVNRGSLHKVLLNYDLAIVPLRNRIFGSVPSKIFEYAKLGIPILYFGGGEGEQLVKKHNLGWTAKAGNYKNLNQLIATISTENFTNEFRKKIKEIGNENFNLEHQLDSLIKLL